MVTAHPKRPSWLTAFVLFIGLAGLAVPAQAQLTVDVDNVGADQLTIAVPAFATPQSTDTPAGTTSDLGNKISDVIVGDLRSSGLFKPLNRNQVRAISFSEVTTPQFPYWQGTSASARSEEHTSELQSRENL